MQKKFKLKLIAAIYNLLYNYTLNKYIISNHFVSCSKIGNDHAHKSWIHNVCIIHLYQTQLQIKQN